MFDWWLVRNVTRSGVLSPDEWKTLLAEGDRWQVGADKRVLWGPARGVIVLVKGEAQLAVEGQAGARLLLLQSGDMTGTLCPYPAVLESKTPITFYTFQQDTWLQALARTPTLLCRLMQQMACRALAYESPAGPRRHNTG